MSLWFVLAINPLSRLLDSSGCSYSVSGVAAFEHKLSHLLYMNDLKVYANQKDRPKLLLDLISNFSRHLYVVRI
uniref:Putative secreted protein n=1 Tax=Panstrongylus lignarius TaxID=156445 RepID=A0A224XXE2_9HEMI